MSLNESIVEDAALTWFGELGYAVGHGPQLAPGEPAAVPACAVHADRRDSFGEVVQADRLREAIPQSRPLATLRDPATAGLPKLLGGELSMAADSVIRESRITAAGGPSQSAASETRRETAR